MTNISLECTYPTCTMGLGETKWKTVATDKSLVGVLLHGHLLAHEQTYVQVVRATWKPNTPIPDQTPMKLASDGTTPVNQDDQVKLEQLQLTSQAPEVKIRGTCWRCAQGGHHGNTTPEILQKTFKAFHHTCTKCGRLGHFAKRCKPQVTGVCWRCAQGGHHGNSEPEILKKMCQAFANNCTKCHRPGH